MNAQHAPTLSNRTFHPVTAFMAMIAIIGVGYAIVEQILPMFAVILVLGAAACLFAFITRPEFIVPVLIVTIPLEISKLLFPFFLVEKSVDGNAVSIVELWRIGLVIAALAFFSTLLSREKFRKPLLGQGHPLILSSLSLLVFCSVQAFLVSPAGSRPLIETCRLASHVFLLIMTASLLNSEKRIELSLKSFVYSGLVLALLGIYQYYSGNFFWNQGLVDYGGTGMNRINVTFGDPNILARYLAILVVVSWVLLAIKVTNTWVLRASAVAGILALLFTFSRSGWSLVPIGMVLSWWYAPPGKRAKTAARGVLVGGLAAAFFFSVGLLRTRAESLSLGIDVLGERLDLIHTGLLIYWDHPIWGVGIGSFESVALSDYSGYLTGAGHYGTLSHTSFITLLAEGGTVGLILALLIFRAVLITLRKIQRGQEETPSVLALCCFVAVILIAISAQSEGRLLEEPILWVFMGMLIALERNAADENMPARQRRYRPLATMGHVPG